VFRRLKLRLRATTDYWRFVVTREVGVVLAGAGVLLGVASLVPTVLALALSVVALVIGFWDFGRDYRDLRSRWSAFDFHALAIGFDQETVPPPARTYARPRYHYFPHGTALTDDEIDLHLVRESVPALLVSEPYRLPAELRATAPYVLRAVTDGRFVFNGPVLGLCDDPVPADGDPRPVRLQKAGFYDHQCSSQLCGFRLRNRLTGEVYDARRRHLVGSTGHLTALSESDLANIVGVSTLALTSDGLTVLSSQSERNSASARLLAPSGSGSLEPRDVRALSGSWSLQDLVIEGMERELREETGIPEGSVAKTTVVGYARWLERGAKPEFLGLTELTIAAAEVTGHGPRTDERFFTAGVLAVDIDWAALGADLMAGRNVMESPVCPRHIRESASVPLLLTLRAVALYLARRPSGDTEDALSGGPAQP
jgi:hypothetical protein